MTECQACHISMLGRQVDQLPVIVYCPVHHPDTVAALVEALVDCMNQIKSFDKAGCLSSQPHGGRLAKAHEALRLAEGRT